MSIEDQARAAVDAASGTGPQAIAARPPASRWGRVHHDLSGMGHALLDMAKLTSRIAFSPKADEAVEVILQMAGLDAEAHEFQAIIDLGNAVIARRQAAAPQPQFLPAPAGTAQPEGAS